MRFQVWPMCIWNKFQVNVSKYTSKAPKVCLIEWKKNCRVHTVLFCLGCARGFVKDVVVVCFWMNDLIFLQTLFGRPVAATPSSIRSQLLMVPNKVWVGEQVGLTGLLWISKRIINCRSKDYTQWLTTYLVILLTFCPE